MTCTPCRSARRGSGAGLAGSRHTASAPSPGVAPLRKAGPGRGGAPDASTRSGWAPPRGEHVGLQGGGDPPQWLTTTATMERRARGGAHGSSARGEGSVDLGGVGCPLRPRRARTEWSRSRRWWLTTRHVKPTTTASLRSWLFWGSRLGFGFGRSGSGYFYTTDRPCARGVRVSGASWTARVGTRWEVLADLIRSSSRHLARFIGRRSANRRRGSSARRREWRRCRRRRIIL